MSSSLLLPSASRRISLRVLSNRSSFSPSLLSLSRPYSTPPPLPASKPYRPSAASPPPRPPPEVETPPPPPPEVEVNTLIIPTVLLALVVGVGYGMLTDASSSLHPKVIMPVIRTLFDAETSHRLAINFMKYGGPFGSKDPKKDTENLEVELFGQILSNPLGVAAGFDKNAEAVDALFGLGFGYVEIGSVTPKPQEGNPKPRFFRLLEDGACINRYGFNSDGHSAVLDNLQARLTSFYKHNKALLPTNHDPSYPFPPQNLNRSLSPHSLLAINLGKNKLSAEDSDEDYLSGVRLFGPYADVLVINVSSPNTPGLRALQGGGRLGTLLGRVVKERDALVVGSDGRRPKVVVKVAPDLGEEQVGDIARAVKESGVDGVIVSNTTIGRPASLKSPLATETGGLSGPPLKPLALSTLRSLRSQLPPLLPIIGCGGISTGSDVLEFVEAGASAVQLYTSFGFNGVGTARKIKDELEEELEKRDVTFRTLVWERRQREVQNQKKAAGMLGVVGEKGRELVEEVKELEKEVRELL